MTAPRNNFISLVCEAFRKEVIKKLIFSRPESSEVTKVTGRICAHRGKRILAIENTLPGNTVSQKNVKEEDIKDELSLLIGEYRQANLITTLGDAEWKASKSGKDILLGGNALQQKLSGDTPAFVSAIEALDKKKSYILNGNEDFLITLGISDKNGRVHDKRQGKFRQINRFLEHIGDIYDKLPKEKRLVIYDLCSGKSYLSFAVYHYLTKIKVREVDMLCIDLKRDVIEWCDTTAKALGYSGMRFVCDDIANVPSEVEPDMVISLHACDIATDIVINRAIELRARIILSTPCCHKYLNDKICAEELSFVTEYPQLKNKLCEALTDSIRLARMSAAGYKVSALELTDPENTPKNTLLRAVREYGVEENALSARKEKYEKLLEFVLGEAKDGYLKEIRK